MRHRGLRAAASLVGVLALSGVARAQGVPAPATPSPTPPQTQTSSDAFIGRTVTDVRFEVEGHPDTTGVLATNVEVRKGQPLRLEDIRNSIVRLSARYDGVSVTGEPTAGGVDLVFHLTPRHPINAIDFVFDGQTALTADDLATGFRRTYGGLPTNARIPAAETAVRRLLGDLGYLDAVVTSTAVPTHNPERATLVFTIMPGEPVRIGQIAVTNKSPWTDEAVLARAGVKMDDIYRQRDTQTAMAALQDDLRAQGYYEAVATVTADRRPPDNKEALSITVDAGPKVVLQIEGDALPKSVGSLDQLVPLKREGAADDDLLETSRARIESRLRGQGYRNALVSYRREAQPDGSLAITYRVTRGPHSVIDRVEVPEENVLGQPLLQQTLKLKAGDPYSDARVQAAAVAVQVAYQQKGYFEAVVTPETESTDRMQGEDSLAVVRLRITQGRRYTISKINFAYAGGQGHISQNELAQVMTSKPGDSYVTRTVSRDRDELEALYLNKGYRAARVEITPATEETPDAVHVTLNVLADEGPQVVVGAITIVGNQRFSDATIREDLVLREGAPFSEADRLQSLAQMNQRGIYRRTNIEEEPRLSGETEASVIVSVEELPATTIGYGGGLEVDRKPTSTDQGLINNLQFAPRGFFEIGRRTLGGRDRSVNLFTRAALKRRNVAADATVPEEPGYSLSEYRATGTYRERRAFDSETELLLGFTAEQGVRTNFSFVRQSVNAEALHHLTRDISVSGRYGLDFTRLFDEQIPPEDQFSIDRLFPQVRLSMLSASMTWDRRNSPLSPTRGLLFSTNVEVAMKAIGSQVGYAKNFFQLSTFHALPTERRVVLAGRIEMGVAHGFQSVPAVVQRMGVPVIGPDGLPVVQPVSDLPASQRFFAGGGGTVRGFQIDLLGAPEVLTAEGLSNGGNAVVILNGEVRALVKKLGKRDLVGVAFADGGNVFRRAVDMDFGQLRGALGVGVRYDSPIGPVRLDFGFKTNRLVFTSGQRERGWEYHLSIGEAF